MYKRQPHYHGAKTPAALTLKYYYGDMAALEALAADGTLQATFGSVSYTHLDVSKRQAIHFPQV